MVVRLTSAEQQSPHRLVLLITDDWYAASHRLALVRDAAAAGWRVFVVTHVRRHRDVLEHAGAEVIHLRWWKEESDGPRRNSWSILIDVIRVYRRLRPELVHHVGMRPVIIGTAAARLAGVRRVVNAIAGRGFVFLSRSLVARAFRPMVVFGLRLALGSSRKVQKRTIVQNPDDFALLTTTRVIKSADVILIRGAGVDLAAFSPAAPPSGPPVVILPARLLWEKGIQEFVVAARMLLASGVIARFALVGPTGRNAKRWVSEEQLGSWSNEGVVEWWGHRDDMESVFRECHIVALPSYGEGLPKALLEAAAAGLPIVTTNVPGCREVVVDGTNGFLVPSHDSASLAAALRKLIESAELRASMGHMSRTRALAYFADGEVTKRTLAVYGSLGDQIERVTPEQQLV